MTAFALGHPLNSHNNTLVRTNKTRINAGDFSLRYTDNQKSGAEGTFHGVRTPQSGSNSQGAPASSPTNQTPEPDAGARRQSQTPERDAGARRQRDKTGGQNWGPDQAKKEASLRSFVKQVQLVSRTSNHPPPSRTAKQLKAQQYRALAPVERTG